MSDKKLPDLETVRKDLDIRRARLIRKIDSARPGLRGARALQHVTEAFGQETINYIQRQNTADTANALKMDVPK